MADKEKIAWHPGFCSAIELELRENRDALEFRREVPLTKEPLSIDLLIVRKKPDEVIKNEIGRFFRGYNILEFKNPADALDIDSFYKVTAYACLYKAETGKTDEIKDTDVTISLVRNTKPEKLLAELDAKFGVRQTGKGIYAIDNALFPMQILVTKEFEYEKHAWLRSLSSNLKQEEAEMLLKNADKLQDKIDVQNVRSVLNVSTAANAEVFTRIFNGGDKL